MPFEWPGFLDVRYRLWRLRRLTALGVTVPLLVFALMGLTGLGAVTSLGGLIIAAGLCLMVIAGHAAIFPNAHQELLAISLVLCIAAVLDPLFSGSVFGWVLFGLVALIVFWVGQSWIPRWELSTKPHQPTFKSKIKTRASLDEARAWFPLRPNHTRGHYRCGTANAQGVFPVWFSAPTVGAMDLFDPDHLDNPAPPDETATGEAMWPSFYAQIEVDDDTFQRTRLLMEDSPDATIQAVEEHVFATSKRGTVVQEIETAYDYPWAQTVSLWLNDYAQDGLVHSRELLEGARPRSLQSTHRWSVLMMFSQWLLKRMVGRSMDAMDARPSHDLVGQAPSSPQKLDALLKRLGAQFRTQGYSADAMPLVTLEEFFDGNRDEGSFQGAGVNQAYDALKELRARGDVDDIRLGVTQWDGPTTWPLAEYLYFVTSAQVTDLKQWLKAARISVSEVQDTDEHRRRDPLNVPNGHKVIWAWID